MRGTPGSAVGGQVRWQVWVGVLGGLGVLGVLTYMVLKKPTPSAQEPSRKRPLQASLRADDTDLQGGLSSHRRRRNNGAKRPSHAPRDVRNPVNPQDGGVPERALSEEPPSERKATPPNIGFLRGRVISLPSRKPISSFTVHYAKIKRGFWFRNSSKSPGHGFPKDAVIQQSTVQHAQGHFDLKLPVGSYLIQIKTPDYQDGNPTPARVQRAGWFRQTFGMLKQGRSALLGQVVGDKNKPISGAYVAALLSGGSRWGWRMMSFGRMAPSAARITAADENGHFKLEGLPAGSYGVVIRASGYTAWQQSGIELTDGEHKDLGVITMDGRTGTIIGTVLGSDGQAAQSSVVAMADGPKGRVVRFARTESGGEYKLTEVPAGSVRLFARQGRGWGFMAPSKSQIIPLKVGETKRVDFRFGERRFRLIGTVFGADNRPIADAKVNVVSRTRGPSPAVSSGSGTTNERGEYSISGLDKGLHSVTVEVNRQPSPGGSVDIKDAETTFNITLRGGELELSFVDQKTNKAPNVPMWVSISWQDTKTQRLMQRAEPGKTVTFSNLPDVSIDVRVFGPGYSTWYQSGVRPGAPDQKKRLTVTLTPAGQLFIKLQTPDKQPPNQVYTLLLLEGKYQWIPSQPTPGGELLIRALPPGPAQIKIVAHGYQPLEVNVDVPSQSPGKAMFELTPLSTPNPKK